MSTLRIDPREAKLPKWAQAAFSDLRDELRRVREDFAEFADDETPEDADAVANPYDEHPRLAARKGETVRFQLRRGAVDLKIDHYDSSLEVKAHGTLAVYPKSADRVILTLPDY